MPSDIDYFNLYFNEDAMAKRSKKQKDMISQILSAVREAGLLSKDGVCRTESMSYGYKRWYAKKDSFTWGRVSPGENDGRRINDLSIDILRELVRAKWVPNLKSHPLALLAAALD